MFSRGLEPCRGRLRLRPNMTEDRESIPISELERECEFEFLRASGPGGQHRNKVETGVRVRHLPTGTLAQATERRSQSQNRRLALERLQEKLERMQRRRKPRVPTRPSKASVEKRLSAKRTQSEKKAQRKPPSRED